MHDQRSVHDLSPDEHRRLAHKVMKRQAGLSLRVASVFAVLLLGIPLFNYYQPDLANTLVGGFTLTWLFLGVLFYPITVGLSFYFVRESDRIEAECLDWRAMLEGEAAQAGTIEETGR